MYNTILMFLIYSSLVCGIIGGLDLIREHYEQEKYLQTREYIREYTQRIEVACLLAMLFLIAVVNFLGYGY